MMAKAIASGADSQRIFSQFGNSPVPVGILVAPELKHAFVANTNADVITAIDLKTWEIADRLTAGKEPDGLGYSRLSVK
jgi:DNA-binding beta-propeller fold protein YncE